MAPDRECRLTPRYSKQFFDQFTRNDWYWFVRIRISFNPLGRSSVRRNSQQGREYLRSALVSNHAGSARRFAAITLSEACLNYYARAKSIFFDFMVRQGRPPTVLAYLVIVL